jgi:DNA-directed RNA polymerase subunit RPC12/RpoP
MKKAPYSIYSYKYVNCPYCETLISEDDNIAQIEDGWEIECPKCGKVFIVNGEF